jgi:hypothetical protein
MKSFKLKKNKNKRPVVILGVKGDLDKPKLPLRLFFKVPSYLPYDDSISSP